MRKRLFLFCVFFLSSLSLSAQKSPKRELRGAWLATFSNIDWPVKTQSVQQQKQAFVNIINHHQQTGINTLFVQVRSQCDAMYPSVLDPWSADLTGTQGQAPSPYWDPMEFMIEECHKRGIEFHAWLNPYRAISNYNTINSFSINHVAKKHPDWLLSSGNLRTLDPGLPQVRSYILDIIRDIVTRYDVDGVHFDDYFYPSSAFNDDLTFSQNARGFTDRANWRRDNVNLLIKDTYAAINQIKSWVKFGISPSGIYRNSSNPAVGTPTSGLEHYSDLYADSKKWIEQGWVDYLAPQVYWYIGQSGADYSKIVPWWNDNAYGRHVYIGLAGYKVNDATQSIFWLNSSEIPNQVRLNRSSNYQNVKGQIVYNTSSMRSANTLSFRDSLRLNLHQKIALKPLMAWKDNVLPAAPKALFGDKYGVDSLVLRWTAPVQATNEFDKVKAYVVYKSLNLMIDTISADDIVAIVNEPKYVDQNIKNGTNYYYKVTALDRYHNESFSSNTVSTLTTSIFNNNNKLSGIIIYPNPSKNYINVNLNRIIKGDVLIKIYDLSGREVYADKKMAKSDELMKIDVSEKLDTGIYALVLQGLEGSYYQKIIVE